MPTFPIAKNIQLGLGQTGDGQTPALVQGVGLIVDVYDPPAEAVWLYPWAASDPAALTGQIPGGLVFGLGSYAGNVYVVNDAGAPVKFLDNGALSGTITVDSLDLGDNDPANFGDADDLVIVHTGTLSSLTNSTGDLVLDNTDTNDQIVLRVGTDTNATGIEFRNNSDAVKFSIDGAGTITVADGSTVLVAGAGTGTGDVVQVYGPDITHGWARYVYQADLTPAAVETAIMTVPAMSRVLVVQSNVQSALTGGGTTVTHGIGITGDVDAYGTASNSGVQADLLTQNAKINAMAGIAANAGASLGVFSAATVALKLIAAATGGAAAGDTALTVGTVRIRVVYETLLPLANA